MRGTLGIGGLALIYAVGYFSTTSLTVGTPYLDWYAYRAFSSRAHFYFFLPIFYLERECDPRNPGYFLQWRITSDGHLRRPQKTPARSETSP